MATKCIESTCQKGLERTTHNPVCGLFREMQQFCTSANSGRINRCLIHRVAQLSQEKIRLTRGTFKPHFVMVDLGPPCGLLFCHSPLTEKKDPHADFLRRWFNNNVENIRGSYGSFSRMTEKRGHTGARKALRMMLPITLSPKK